MSDNKNKSTSLNNMIFCGIAAIIIIIFFVWLHENTNDSSNDRNIDAWVCAQNAVQEELKSPSSAKFCKYPEATIKDIGNDKYSITGWVDADNSFGANIRTDFTVKLTLTSKGYKDAQCYFGDDSIWAIAEDAINEKSNENNNDSMKEYIGELIDEECPEKHTEASEVKSTEKNTESEETLNEKNIRLATTDYYNNDLSSALEKISKIQNKTEEILKIENDILNFENIYSSWLGEWFYSSTDKESSLLIRPQYNATTDKLEMVFEKGKTTDGEKIIYDLYEYNQDSLIYHSNRFDVFSYTTVLMISESQIELNTTTKNTGAITSSVMYKK